MRGSARISGRSLRKGTKIGVLEEPLLIGQTLRSHTRSQDVVGQVGKFSRARIVPFGKSQGWWAEPWKGASQVGRT